MADNRLELPPRTRDQLNAFRRLVWWVKLAEGVLASIFALLLSYLLVFTLDRFVDTPAWLRLGLLAAGVLVLGVGLPWKWYRWVWKTRRLEQVARLLRYRFPRLSDRLLGIVELVQSEWEQDRSETLCRAALAQVDAQARERDFRGAVPDARHRQWLAAVSVPVVVALAILLLVPAAGSNALMRWLFPARQIERYTFAQLEPLPAQLVVPYAEPFQLEARLSDTTVWTPSTAAARYRQQREITAKRMGDGYRFRFPSQKSPGTVQVTVGDASASVLVQPTTRPELTALEAEVQLPQYLQRASASRHDVRGGVLSLVKGSSATLRATATRALASAEMDGRAVQVSGQEMLTTPVAVTEAGTRKLRWRDHFGLTAKEPFVLSIQAVDDEAPTVGCRQLLRQQVLLESDVLRFQVLAHDDFGVKATGMEWRGMEDPVYNPRPAEGEKLLSSGGPELRDVEADASFSPAGEGIAPQTLRVRFFAVDYLPDRERVYSPEYVLHVLSAEEHAIWLTQEMRRWFRGAQDVYQREQQLHQTNRELRSLEAAQLERPETRRQLEKQAAAERANARRLSGLVSNGEQLLQMAVKNDQFNVATMETWADMVQSLKDISARRMPSVADLLAEAAAAPSEASPTGAEGSPGDSEASPAAPEVGVRRDAQSGKKAPGPGESKSDQPPVPGIVDVESSFDNDVPEQGEQDDAPPSSAGAPSLRLPSTVVQGGGPPPDPSQACPVQQKVEQAVEEQEGLLDEFARVADELQRILNNLEGSTFVKRLKAASRRQLQVAGQLNRSLRDAFGLSDQRVPEPLRQNALQVADREDSYSQDVYTIQEDLLAYFNRVQQPQFQDVLQEMKETQVVASVAEIGATVRSNHRGQALAQAEFWADTLDRWAEQLIGPGCPSGGT